MLEPTEAVRRLGHAVQSGDPELVDEALSVLADVVAGLPEHDEQRPPAVANLARGHKWRFDRSGVPADLMAAIDVGSEAVTWDAAIEERPAAITDLINVLRIAFSLSGDRAFLDEAVTIGRAVAGARSTPPPGLLSNLNVVLKIRYENFGVDDDLVDAIAFGEQAVELIDPSSPAAGTCWCDLGAALLTAVDGFGAVDHVDRAVTCFETALELSTDDDPRRATYLSNLATAFTDRHELTGDLESLESAIDAGRRAVTAAGPDDPQRGAILANLSLGLVTAFERIGDVDLLEEAITVGEVALADLPPDGFARSMIESNVGVAYQRRFERFGRRADLAAAVDHATAAVETCPPDAPNRSNLLADLGSTLRARYENTGDAADLDRCIDCYRSGLEVATNDGDRATCWSNLGLALASRFGRYGRRPDLEEAVGAGEAAVRATGDGHPSLPLYQSNLGATYRTRYHVTRAVVDLDRAVELSDAAVRSSPPDHPDLALYLSNAGIFLADRFAVTGAAADLDRAIENCREAIARTPVGHPELGLYHTNAGLFLRSRFELAGGLPDLDAAVEHGEEALRATGPTDAGRSGRLTNLAAALITRFGRTGDDRDLDRAVEVGTEAARTPNFGVFEQAAALSNLAIALRARFERDGNAGDLDRAVDAYREADGLLPEEHADRVALASNLGLTLRLRSALTGDADDLASAIEAGRRAVAAVGADHPDRAMHLCNLAGSLTLGSLVDDRLPGEDARDAFREAARLEGAPMHIRIHAARQWARTDAGHGRWEAAVDAYTETVRMLGLLAHRSLDRSDQEYRLADVAGIGGEATAAGLFAGDVDRAVELFEQGRAVLFQQVLDLQQDVDDLEAQHPDLAAEFVRRRAAVDHAGERSAEHPGDPMATALLEQRRRAAARFDDIVTRIRRIEGFERFLQPPVVSELAEAAAEGPVVLVNVSDLRSDAIIVLADRSAVVPLPALTADRLEREVERFWGSLADALNPRLTPESRNDAEATLIECLGWLWEVVVGPTLEASVLQSLVASSAEPVRLWWCPSGPLTLLPLHAAGRHGTRFDAVPETALDRIVSSYTPSLRSLLHARRRRHDPAGAGVTVVAMPTTPDADDLPGAATEAELVAEQFEGRSTVLGVTEPATRDTVTAGLERWPFAHFACHGVSEFGRPSEARLLLADHQDNPFTVTYMARARLPAAELAVLSACTTFRPGTDLLDEPIHLAAACQLAGFSSVVASLWPIDDVDSGRLHRRFYSVLGDDSTRSAVALHSGVRRLRSIYADWPSRWAAFCHLGR